MALASTTKGSSTVAKYFVKMKNLADEMASAGHKLEDEELVSYILNGLGDDFDGPVFAISARVELITVTECYAQLMAYEQRKEMHRGGALSPPSTPSPKEAKAVATTPTTTSVAVVAMVAEEVLVAAMVGATMARTSWLACFARSVASRATWRLAATIAMLSATLDPHNTSRRVHPP
jgi:hypothetical protein